MSFSKELALKLANFSLESYFNFTYRKDNKSFLIHEEKDSQYIIFTGSYDIKDWTENAEFVKVERDGMGKLHNGIADHFDELKKEVLKRINPGKKLYIGGHSLGGSLGAICALYLHNKGFKIESVYTFGMPRTGNKEWKNRFDDTKIEHYRVVNAKDVVTTIPKLFYWHVGKEIHINRKGFFTWFHDGFFDHKMEEYIKHISKMG